MDVAQFNEYQQNLARAAQERQIQYDQSTPTNAIEKITAKLLKQTTFCDGSSDVATRAWLDDIDLAFQRVGQAYVVDIVSSSVTGSLRKEVEHFIQQAVNNLVVTRDAITWPSIRAHVVKSFLNVDEAAALRDAVENIRQSVFETDASYVRRFRELAQKSYPDPHNDDQSRILVRSFARGLRTPAVAVKMIEQANPHTLYEAMLWLSNYSERSDAISRLGLREETPMEISSVPPSQSKATMLDPPASTLEQVLKGQERLMTKLAKLEAVQQNTAPRGWNKPDGQRPPMAPPRNLAPPPNWSPDGQPRCFGCGDYGHMRRTCPKAVRYSTRQSQRGHFRQMPKN